VIWCGGGRQGAKTSEGKKKSGWNELRKSRGIWNKGSRKGLGVFVAAEDGGGLARGRRGRKRGGRGWVWQGVDS